MSFSISVLLSLNIYPKSPLTPVPLELTSNDSVRRCLFGIKATEADLL